jgi:hypothetical protein
MHRRKDAVREMDAVRGKAVASPGLTRAAPPAHGNHRYYFWEVEQPYSPPAATLSAAGLRAQPTGIGSVEVLQEGSATAGVVRRGPGVPP